MDVLIFVLALAAFLFLFFKLILWYATAVAKAMVERRHRDAELILATGRVPPGWARGAQAGKMPSVAGPETRAVKRARSRALRRLGSLMSYLRRTTLVDSEETRNTMLEQLVVIRERWQQAEWGEIRPEPPAFDPPHAGERS